MSDKKFYEDTGFWGGFGLYYLMIWIFAFYPAFIVTFTLQRMFFGIDGEGEADVFAVVGMIILTLIIYALVKARQYLIVLLLYILTAWPFLYILYHLWSCKEGSEYPLPLDWWPLW